MADARESIARYLASHPYIQLGTVTPGGTPQVHTVSFVADGPVVYFATDRDSRKARNILANRTVAFVCDEDYEDWSVIQGVQMEGDAFPVDNPEEIERVGRMMLEKFPQARDMPENANLVFFRIEPLRGYYLDNTVSFAHRDEVEF
jgi:general stress protein 26